jgi:hypothetical protein
MKLPKPLLLAIARYYINRSNQSKVVHSGAGYEVRETVKGSWDKESDLDFIKSKCPEDISYYSIAGTFFFSKGKNKLEINDGTFCDHIA